MQQRLEQHVCHFHQPKLQNSPHIAQYDTRRPRGQHCFTYNSKCTIYNGCASMASPFVQEMTTLAFLGAGASSHIASSASTDSSSCSGSADAFKALKSNSAGAAAYSAGAAL